MIWKQFTKKYLKVLQSKFILLLIFLSILISCTNNKDKKELLFLITLDTTRADAINYDINNKITPNIANLASAGISFKNAYSLIPITLPSHFSMFYSMPPWMTKVYNNGDKTKIKYSGLTEIIKKKGYYTGAVISLGVLKSDFGLNKGFNVFKENFSPGLWYRSAEDVNKDLFSLIDQVKRKKAFYWIHYSDPHDPYFPPKYKGEFNLMFNGQKIYTTESTKSINISVKLDLKPGKNQLKFMTEIPENFSDNMRKNVNGIGLRDFEIKTLTETKNYQLLPEQVWVKRKVKSRTDYVTSSMNSNFQIINESDSILPVKISFIYSMRIENAFKKNMYLEEISYMDTKIGDLMRFLKKKNLFKYSTFVIIGDHGEGFGEYNNHIGHIHYLNKVYMNVPLIISGNGIKKEAAKKRLTSNLDIAPTILDIIKIKKPKYMRGNSLLKTSDNQQVFFETYRPQAYMNSFSIIEYPYQLIYFPEKTTSKKYEFINLETDQFGVNNILNREMALKKKMIQKVRKISKLCLRNKKSNTKISKKDEDILKSLGYI